MDEETDKSEEYLSLEVKAIAFAFLLLFRTALTGCMEEREREERELNCKNASSSAPPLPSTDCSALGGLFKPGP